MTGTDQRVDFSAVAETDLPMAFAEWHRSHSVGDRIAAELGRKRGETPLPDVMHCAGFEAVTVRGTTLRATRAYTLASTLGPGLRLVTCGLNPSPLAADVGVGFARKGNRFWPALVAAGIVEHERDPIAAVHRFGVGMTDLVKRPSARADEITAEEYRDGMARLDRLAAWLEPNVICMVGLDGWRKTVDRKAVSGWQSTRLGGRPVYVMPNTSGLNASSTPADFVAHLRRAMAGPPVIA